MKRKSLPVDNWYKVKEASKNSTRVSKVWAIQKENTKIEISVCFLHISAGSPVFLTGPACIFCTAFIQIPFLLLCTVFAFPFSQKPGSLSKFQGTRHEFLFHWIFCLTYLTQFLCKVSYKSIFFTIRWLFNLYYINENLHGKKPHSNVNRMPFNWICQASLLGICLAIRAVYSPSCQMILS